MTTGTARDSVGAPADSRGSAARANVLIVYALLDHPLRSTVHDHLYSFGRYSPHRVFYINLGVRKLPRWLAEIEFDLVIFHTTLLATRWTPPQWRAVTDRALALPRRDEVRMAMPQDDFLRSALVTEFVQEAGVGIVCSAAREAEWPKIYPDLDRTRVHFHKVLTGYLDEHTVKRVAAMTDAGQARPTTIGYRAHPIPAWLGRHGRLKVDVAEPLRSAAIARGLTVDLSTRLQDTLLGDDWFRFLARCRYQLGVEGGASILDMDGSLKECTETYVREHPRATFEEIEEACFPGRDGELSLFVLTPRHLEACATLTCQVLVDGAYDGVLEAGVHYLALRRDLANLPEVLDSIQTDELRADLVENAHRDIVRSGRYSYRSFVEEIERIGLRSIARHDEREHAHRWTRAQRLDRLSRGEVVVLANAVRLGSRVLRPLRAARRRAATIPKRVRHRGNRRGRP